MPAAAERRRRRSKSVSTRGICWQQPFWCIAAGGWRGGQSASACTSRRRRRDPHRNALKDAANHRNARKDAAIRRDPHCSALNQSWCSPGGSKTCSTLHRARTSPSPGGCGPAVHLHTLATDVLRAARKHAAAAAVLTNPRAAKSPVQEFDPCRRRGAGDDHCSCICAHPHYYYCYAWAQACHLTLSRISPSRFGGRNRRHAPCFRSWWVVCSRLTRPKHPRLQRRHCAAG